MKELAELGHLLVFAFLFCFGAFMAAPVITDVTMEALCPGRDECSLAIYLTGLQQSVTALGAVVVTPIVCNLSDRYGRKALLTLPATVSIVPLAILACGRTKTYFYAYYITKTLTAMISDGSMMCLSLAYVADKVPEVRRAAAFGVFSGVCTAGFVVGTIAARFLPVSSTFQVSAVAAVAAAVYMRAFVQETDGGALLLRDEEASHPLCLPSSSNEEASPRLPPLRKGPSLSEMAALLTSSSTLSRAAVVTFFHSLGDTGLQTAVLVLLFSPVGKKIQQTSKTIDVDSNDVNTTQRFLLKELIFPEGTVPLYQEPVCNLLLIIGITGSFSQLTVMPLLAPKLGEHKLLIVALLGSCMNVMAPILGFLYSIAWSFWVPYLAASLVILSILVSPCIRSIVSKRVGPSEQGMVQACITGISSTANVISPLVFTPLTAWFLSETAPFNFKGFSLACAGFATLVALTMSINMRPA